MRNEKKIFEAITNVKNHGWQIVELRNCGLKEFPIELYVFSDLVSIDLGNDEFSDRNNHNVITEIPDGISNIKRLSRLNLENTGLVKISDELSKLTNLKYLNLRGNKLKELPERIANMEQLRELFISDNPFDMLPPEIVARGIDSIRNFLKELKEQDFLYELKLIIVGEGRVGKTCLSKALIQSNYSLEDEESTEGININRWVIPKNEIQKINPSIGRDFQINIWDFGGQEIYHSTHQFFLTKRSIYLLVTESRKEDSHDDFFYWLNIIQLLGDQSPVMMILNKCDQPTKELPIKEYKATFNNIVSFNKISLCSEYRDSFSEFRNKILEIACQLPHIGNPLPKVWVDIRRDIEDLKLSGKDYISRDEYLEICRQHYRREDSALFLSEYFHDLGVIMHFQNDLELKDLVILNHEWITKGVYKILDDKQVIAQKGRFNNDDLLRIWASNEHGLKAKELISLMKNTKFDLCFEVGSGEYLVPRLLPVDEVEHDWKRNTENSKFEFRYKFMPKGILTRLIVKMNRDINQDYYWRYGVLLKYDSTYAIIREKYFESKISVELSGENKREYLYMIRKALNEIHEDFNNLEYSEMIPCNCDYCVKSENPFFYEYSLLRRYECNGISDIRCEISLVEIPVYNLTANLVTRTFNSDRIIVCENQNASFLNSMGIAKTKFFPERDSSSVFMKVKLNVDVYGLRDRDYLLDSEIQRITSRYKNYIILSYYCIENYLYHPDNLAELNLEGFNREGYISELIKQKNAVKNVVISNFKNARTSYTEFRIEAEKLKDKKGEMGIVEYIESDDIEVFFKAYSMKDHFNKESLSRYGLDAFDLSATKWFRNALISLIGESDS